jgi:hypothetical protein
MVEKCTWNAEDEILALEAKFNSTMKSLYKKVSFESSKKKVAKTVADKPSSKKKEGDHPKKWKAPKQGNKKKVEFKGRTKGLATSAAGDKQKREWIGPHKRKPIEKKIKVAMAYMAKVEQFAEKDTRQQKTKAASDGAGGLTH